VRNELRRWIVLEGAVNVRDLGGLPTTDGQLTRFGRIFRSDNLQGLTAADVDRLVGELDLRDVIDLRSREEVELEGPGPLTRVPAVTVHHLTLFSEGGRHTDAEADTGPVAAAADRRRAVRSPDGATTGGDTTGGDTAGETAAVGSAAVGSAAGRIDGERVLPWSRGRAEDELAESRVVGHYSGYLRDRPDSVIAAMRVLAHGDGAAIVHCAAGKDRTGVLTALVLEVAGVTREAIIADYVATAERMDRVLARLRASDTYRADLDSRPADAHLPRPEYMAGFLRYLDDRFGGPLGWLARHGWREHDHRALRARLLD
jgi:Protein tyrosine/serine phosphatase